MTTTVLEQQRIEHERDYDTLTGLYRRRAFDRACDALFQQPEKLGCAALLMMDLDNLKQINDTYGHDWGDQYIRQTGQCFAANTPANTICSRLSGDEFLIFFYGYQDQAQLRAQLELLSAALQRSVSILPNGKQLHISISGGIAWYPTDGHDLLTLKNMPTLPCIRSSIPTRAACVILILAATIRRHTPPRPSRTLSSCCRRSWCPTTSSPSTLPAAAGSQPTRPSCGWICPPCTPRSGHAAGP